MTPIEQLRAERLTGLGSSDAHHLFSTAPWGCARRLFYEKSGVPADFPENETRILRALRRGEVLEPVAATLYEEATARRLWRAGIRRHRTASELMVHQDRQILRVEDRPGRGVLEIKVPGMRAYLKYSREGLAAAYVLQLQWAFMVTGTQWGAFCMLWADGFEIKAFDVERDEQLVDALFERGRRAWREIQERREPDPLPDVNDPRCARCPWRRTCRGAAIAIIDEVRDVDVVTDETLAPVVSDYLEAKEYRAKAEELEETIGDALREKMGGREIVFAGGHKVYYKAPSETVYLDEKAIKTAKPGFVRWLYDRFGKKRANARRLRVY